MQILTTKQIAAMVAVTPRSRGSARHTLNSIKERALSEAYYCAGLPMHTVYFRVGEAAQRVQHATETGRIWGATISTFRAMTPYQVCKLVATLAAQVEHWSGIDAEAVEVIRKAIEEQA